MKTYLFAATICLAVMGATSGQSAAAAYPDRPITMTVPFPAGGGVDVVGRLYTNEITQRTGAVIVIDNKAGSGGIIGVGAAARAKPDGYQFVMGSPGNISIAPSAYKSLSYNPAKDLTPVAMGVQIPLLLVTRPDAPFGSVPELVRYGKEHPGKLSYASGGTGTSQHLSGAMFVQMSGLNAQHIPYKGTSPALTDLMGGRVDFAFLDTSAVSNIKAGKIKLLAVTSAKRSALFPDTPTVAEGGVAGYEALNWYGFFAPAGTPAESVSWLYQQIKTAQGDQGLAEKFKAQTMEIPPAMDPAGFAKFVAADTAKWTQLIKSLGLKLD